MITDIEAGQIDIVAVYKFDRLSRSQLDFLQTIAFFEKHGVGFVSTTQQLDTSTSMGRCMMNVMSAFAQLEREVISERTRDKIQAARRKGLWTGGRPILGYDAAAKKLVVNEEEAEQVRGIFALYLESGSLLSVVAELKRRGWKSKTWVTQGGQHVAARALGKTAVHATLTNVLYAGRIRAGNEIVDGQHDAIIDQETWDAVQRQLAANGTGKGGPVPHQPGKTGALLQGLVRCARCDTAMAPHSTKRGRRKYRYYVCSTRQKHGATACPGSRIAVGKLEAAVIGQIRVIGRDPAVIEAAASAAQREQCERRPEVAAELRRLVSERTQLQRESANLVDAVAQGGTNASAFAMRLDEIDSELAAVDEREAGLREELRQLNHDVDVAGLTEALAEFDGVWEELVPKERARLLALLIERVSFDGQTGDIEIAFRDGAPEALRAAEVTA